MNIYIFVILVEKIELESMKYSNIQFITTFLLSANMEHTDMDKIQWMCENLILGAIHV